MRTSYEIRASEVLTAVFDLDYRIPDPETFRKQLSDKKIVAMPVESAPDGDLVTEDLDAFMNYVRLNGIKTVMYRFRFYTEDDFDDLFKLSPADRAFFGKIPDRDALSEYQRYCSYLSAAIDLEHPKSVSLYVLHNQSVICCETEDFWMERLPLPNARMIRKICLDSKSYSGSNADLIDFHFDYDTADPAEETAEPAAESASDIKENAFEIMEEPVPVTEETVLETVEEIIPVTEETAPETAEEIIPVNEETAPETMEETVQAAEKTASTITLNTEHSEYPAPDLASADAEIIEGIVPQITASPDTSGKPKKQKKQRGLFKNKKHK